MSKALSNLLKEIERCSLCANELPYAPRPVVRAHSKSKILVVGQAPGKRVHETGIPFNDPSGDRLRAWMGVTREQFYDEHSIALVPMGFCYPGTGKGGDLPPRPECAVQWRSSILNCLKHVSLTLVIGQYAQAYHLPGIERGTVTETVKKWTVFWPSLMPMPHPSPRNNRWLKANPWFEAEVIPQLQRRVHSLLVGKE